MKQAHKEILTLLSEYLQAHPELRFGQALFNLGVNEFSNRTDPEKDDYHTRDIHADSDGEILARMKDSLRK